MSWAGKSQAEIIGEINAILDEARTYEGENPQFVVMPPQTYANWQRARDRFGIMAQRRSLERLVPSCQRPEREWWF